MQSLQMSAPQRETIESIVEAGILALFASGDSPAFATNSRQRITFWNAAAERLLKLNANEVLGKRCFEMIQGRDVFGNCFCYEGCPLQATLRRGENTRTFELIAYPGGAAARPLTVTAVLVQEDGPQVLSLIHILRPAANESSSASRSVDAGPAPASPDGPPLTARETEVLRCIGCGLQNKEIAERLRISPATVRNHVHHLLEKLKLHSKLQAASLAHRRGWVPAE
jgi:DNA-binding CsgD family transcriptional regulator